IKKSLSQKRCAAVFPDAAYVNYFSTHTGRYGCGIRHIVKFYRCPCIKNKTGRKGTCLIQSRIIHSYHLTTTIQARKIFNTASGLVATTSFTFDKLLYTVMKLSYTLIRVGFSITTANWTIVACTGKIILQF